MRILILGVTGMVGHVAWRVLSRNHEVYGTSRGRYRWLVDPARCFVEIDLENRDGIEQTLAHCKPDLVLNCIGLVRQRPEAADDHALTRTNARFPHQLAGLCDSVGAKLVHLSSDCVFSGAVGNYCAEDTPDPADGYGRSKLLGEVSRAPHLTIRTSLVGRQLVGAYSLVEWFIAQRGGRVFGFVHAIFSGLTTYAFASILDDLVSRHPKLSGLYHVASTPISKHDLLVGLNAKLRLGIEVIPRNEPRLNRCLDGSRFVAQTRIETPSWEEMLTRFADASADYDAWRSAV